MKRTKHLAIASGLITLTCFLACARNLQPDHDSVLVVKGYIINDQGSNAINTSTGEKRVIKFLEEYNLLKSDSDITTIDYQGEQYEIKSSDGSSSIGKLEQVEFHGMKFTIDDEIYEYGYDNRYNQTGIRSKMYLNSRMKCKFRNS